MCEGATQRRRKCRVCCLPSISRSLASPSRLRVSSFWGALGLGPSLPLAAFALLLWQRAGAKGADTHWEVAIV